MNNLNLPTLLEQLKMLEKELTEQGAPKTAIRRCQDLEVSINWLEKHARR
jgi:hypothetical protein